MHYLAGVFLILAWLLYFWRLHDPAVALLVYLGWGVLAAGLVLIGLAMATLRGRGQAGKGEEWTSSTVLVESGVYALVRHPLYLGWLLMYLAAILFSQHWIVAIVAILGSASMIQIVRQEDQHLIEKFGAAYRSYMESVPALNLAAGVARRLWRRRGT